MDQLIPQSEGIVFGNFTTPGFAGNAAMFDGVTAHNFPAVGAYRLGTSAYIGKEFSVGKLISRAVIHGWNDRGLIDDGSSGVAYLYASNTAPAHQTDGVLLGQSSFTEPTPLAYGAPLEIVSGDDMTSFKYVWVVVVAAAVATGICGAELFLYTKGTASPPPATAEKPLAIFLGSGQSNMRGDAPIPDQAVYPNRSRLKTFALDGTIKPAADPLMATAGSQWSQYPDANPKCGPMMSFSNELVASFKNFDILIVNSSKGGTSIEEWAKGQPLYDGMIQRAKAALAAAPAGSFIAGFVWQQGESNTASEASAAGWVTQFKALISNVRADLEIADLPVVMIGLGPYDAFGPAWPQLRFAQQYMVLPQNTVYVKTFDLPNGPSPDWVNTDSVLSIGKRAAAAMKPMLPRMM